MYKTWKKRIFTWNFGKEIAFRHFTNNNSNDDDDDDDQSDNILYKLLTCQKKSVTGEKFSSTYRKKVNCLKVNV